LPSISYLLERPALFDGLRSGLPNWVAYDASQSHNNAAELPDFTICVGSGLSWAGTGRPDHDSAINGYDDKVFPWDFVCKKASDRNNRRCISRRR